jgi:6-phosphogluconolactonase
MIRVFRNHRTLSGAAAGYIAEAGRRAIAENDVFHLVLSGGGTPTATYERLAETTPSDSAFWRKVQIYWSDERCVAPDDHRSNYLMAKEALFDRVAIPAGNIHRIAGEAAEPQAVADAYAAVFPARPDLLMLGIGADGHTASLFPHSPALEETRRPFVAVEAPVEPRERITISPPALTTARDIVVLVSGRGKAEVLARIFDETNTIARTPAKLVRNALWLIDQAAADLLLRSAMIESGLIEVDELQ